MPLDRRSMLRTTAATAAAGPFAGLVATSARASHGPVHSELVPVPDKRDGVVRLHLPPDFEYRSFHDTAQPVTLTDGTSLPGRHDGMAAFDGPSNTVILVRNHEINSPQAPFGPGTPYDGRGGGGTTTVQVTKQGQVVRSFTSLNGTMMNCSGGAMPWGSWITCEETINGPDVGPDFTGASNVPLEERHGYIFEVPASRFPGSGQSDRRPIRNAGRFAHEAVSFDPVGGHLYLTEDNFGFASGFYRYTPPAGNNPMADGRLEDGGTLEMLAVAGVPNAHLEATQPQDTEYDVTWVPIPEPDVAYRYKPGRTARTSNDTGLTHVGSQGWEQGAAFFSRLEGQIYEDGIVYFTSTQGGGPPEPGTAAGDTGGYGNGYGQVWAYDPARAKLRLVFQSSGPMQMELPDNITTSPRGTLVVCEDGPADNFLRGLTPEGDLFDIAVNAIEGRRGDEFAGSTFSPDGHTLFVNIQSSRGMTFAIWGPWDSIGV